MEKESFEDNEVANLLNKSFVAIKVDKEERPDVDSIYMSVCQALTGSGGWPLTIIMTQDKKPFFAGTYFPKNSRQGRTGVMELADGIAGAWKDRREELISQSQKILKSLTKTAKISTGEALDMDTAHEAFKELNQYFDPKYGGFGREPKFPTAHNMSFLLKYWKATGEKKALDIVEKTLESMYKGGIFDHIGYGFSRYSTDNKWLVPHFEKMLYDNALLAVAYVEAYQATSKKLYREVAEKIFRYILRDMTSEEGAFYSAEDADSEGVEGKFYLWTDKQVREVLGENASAEFSKAYNISARGNFEGENIPNLIDKDLNIPQGVLNERLELYRKELFDIREKRVHPYKDDKVLTAWNGLMIAALAIGGKVFESPQYILAAKRSVDFIYKKLFREDGRLLARYRQGEAAFVAYLEDYAFLINGLIELYKATFELDYLNKALKLNDNMLKLFLDNEEGGLFLYGEDGEKLIMRPKEAYDGAIPSGNSVAAYNMLWLGKVTGNKNLEEKGELQFDVFGETIKRNPSSYCFFMSSLLFNLIPTKEFVISGDKDSEELKSMVKEINKLFLPFSTTVLNSNEEIKKLNPMLNNQVMINGKATAYVCENYTCGEPITELEKFKANLVK